MRKILFVVIGIILSGQLLLSQELLLDLPYNPLLTGFSPQKSSEMVTATLPFFDDFSYTGVEPDSELWSDHSIFVNNSYAQGNPTLGVATFDAVTVNGQHYSTASSEPFKADQLISQAIDLSTVDLSSTWLSFYYQPQGKGNAPEFNDSLILEFTGPGSDWHKVWYDNGSTFADFREDVLGIDPIRSADTNEFKLVMIKVDSSVYQSDAFRFRFRNYASLSGDYNSSAAVNCDHWNIDFVYLNEGRSADDSVFNDIAFVDEPNSILRNFESVPWSHYYEVQKQERSREYFHIRNNYYQQSLVSATEFLMTNTETNELIDAFNVGGFSIAGYTNNESNWQFDQDPFYNVVGVDELHVTFELRLTANDIFADNNSSFKEFHFENYYAYDDGSAENAYAVDAVGAKVALMYNSYVPDILKGVSMYFLPIHPASDEEMKFNLYVWDDNNGEPGDVLYLEEGISQTFSAEMNSMVQYELSEDVPVDGPFYIGWSQNDDSRLNVGFDRNKDNSDQLLYNIYGTWENSSLSGSLMMHPIIGTIGETAIQLAAIDKQSLTVYPNPANEYIHLSGLINENDNIVSIYNSLGKLQKQSHLVSSELNVSDLDKGIYIVKISSNGIIQTSKLVISR